MNPLLVWLMSATLPVGMQDGGLAPAASVPMATPSLSAATPLPAPPARTGVTPAGAPPGTPSGDDAGQQMLAIGALEERMTVPVSVAGDGPHRFVIDTGAQRTVIARQLAETLGLKPGPRVTLTAMTGKKTVDTVRIPLLRLSERTSTSDITAPSLEAMHLGASGLLGIDALAGHAVTIDFDGRTMAVRPSKRVRGAAMSRGDEIVVVAQSRMGQLIVTDASFDGRRIQVVIDTGSSVSIGNTALKRLVQRQTSRPTPISVTSVTGDVLYTEYALVDQVKLGGVAFRGLPIAFQDVAPFERFGLMRRPALLLGMDALRAFREVEIDFTNRRIRMAMPRGTRQTRLAGL